MRWIFGDHLGPHFLDAEDEPVLMIESRRVLARWRFHRAKAHLVLSAMRHRAAELGDRCTYGQVDTHGEALDAIDESVSVVHPTSMANAKPGWAPVTSVEFGRAWALGTLLHDARPRTPRPAAVYLAGGTIGDHASHTRCGQSARVP